MSTLVPDVLNKQSSGCALTNGNGASGILTSVVGSLNLGTITSSLQEVIFNVQELVSDPLSILANVSTSVNGAFVGIITTCKSLGKTVKGIVGSVDKALSGVSLAITSFIDSIESLTSTTVGELSHHINFSLKEIIQSFVKLVGTVRSIQNTSSKVSAALESILKASIIVTRDSLKTISIGLNELNLFVPVKLATVVKTLEEQVTDLDVTLPVDIDDIVDRLQSCSEGTVVDMEMVSSTLDGSTDNVDVVISAISTCPPDGRWAPPLDELLSVISRSFDEILCTIESVTQVVPDWNQLICPATLNVLVSTQ